ncbi:MipA/OmpV family protein [Sphingomonas sp.]|uniref:MipA/OmpV family protein n=1 Tax=Sphingomonas sp. TaxID=28214 RepID=UPI002FCB4D73
MGSAPITLRVLSRATAAAVALAGAAVPAFAQDAGAAGTQDEDRGWTIRVGAGPQLIPTYPGSDEYQVGFFPVLGFRKTGDPLPFGAPGDSPGLTINPNKPLEFGPVANFAPERKAVEDGVPIGKVDFTPEVGAFAQFRLHPNIRVRVEGRKGLGGHKGWIGSAGVDYIVRDADRFVFSIGPRATFVNQRYQRAYYGVSPTVAAATGLAVYDPDGGLNSFGAAAGLLYQFNYNWGVQGFARYERLVKDAAESPIVRDIGSRNQYFAGAALTYTFDIGKIF